MQDISINEIKNSACGTDSEGNAKAIVIAGLQKFNVNDTTAEPESLMEVSTIEAIVDIKTIGNFSYVNLKFPAADNSDLALFYRLFERYYDVAGENDDEHEIVAFLSIIPLELEGQYTINAMYPVFWALEPDLVGDSPRTIRSVYIPEDVQFIRTELNDGELDEIIAKAQNEELYNPAEEIYQNEAADEFEEAIEERNNSFTDDKYDFGNGADPFTFDEVN